MADHLRTQIRDALVTLFTGLTTTGSNVFTNFIRPLEDAELPGLSLGFPEEEIAVSSGQKTVKKRKTFRTLTYPIVGRAKQTGDIENTLNNIAKEVEAAWATDRLLGGLLNASELSSIEMEILPEGEKPIGMVTITFTLVYSCVEGSPDATFVGHTRGWVSN